MANVRVKDAARAADFANTHLFVYGTLRKGFRSHNLLRRLRAKFLAGGHVQGRLYDLGDYPGAVKSTKDAERVRGEVYVLPNAPQAFKVLDRFEGFDSENPASSLFERKEATVTLAGGEQIEAWIFWLRNSHRFARRVPSGDYAMCRR